MVENAEKAGVHQTRFGGPDKPPEERGNCFGACLATILEVPIEELPAVAADESGWTIISDWLHERGWFLLEKPHNPSDGWIPGYTIMGVGSMYEKIRDASEGGGHVVVARDGMPWWNPNPSDTRDAEELIESAAARGDAAVSYILYPLDPARPKPIKGAP